MARCLGPLDEIADVGKGRGKKDVVGVPNPNGGAKEAQGAADGELGEGGEVAAWHGRASGFCSRIFSLKVFEFNLSSPSSPSPRSWEEWEEWEESIEMGGRSQTRTEEPRRCRM